MSKQTKASVADDAEYGENGYVCEHCGVPVVFGYDGLSDRTWSHYFGDSRNGRQRCNGGME